MKMSGEEKRLGMVRLRDSCRAIMRGEKIGSVMALDLMREIVEWAEQKDCQPLDITADYLRSAGAPNVRETAWFSADGYTPRTRMELCKHLLNLALADITTNQVHGGTYMHIREAILHLSPASSNGLRRVLSGGLEALSAGRVSEAHDRLLSVAIKLEGRRNGDGN